MQFERIKKNHKKEILIGAVITLGIVSAITLTTTRAKYRLTQSIKIVEGEINYKPYDFKIMAMYQQKDDVTCTEDSCYNEITDRMPNSGYIINESKSYCTLDNKTKDTEAKVYTYNGKHVFENLKKTDKCYIWFDKKTSVDNAQELLAKVQLEAKTSPTTFSGAETNDAGIYKVADGMYGGTSYYWRGAATTNHVIFANKCWRIVRINGDGTIRLIYNGTPTTSETCPGNGSNSASIAITNQAYNSNYNQSNYVGWTYSGASQRTLSGTPSNAKTQTENWFNDNSNFTNTQRAQVTDGKFCNDRNTASESTWTINGSTTIYYAAYGRLENAKTPTLSCVNSGDVYTLKVGAITADEVMFAGGWKANNTSYYLYNGQNYWTMSPCGWWNAGDYAYMFIVGTNGNHASSGVSSTTPGIRPVINLKADTTFQSGGLGTSTKPYVVQ